MTAASPSGANQFQDPHLQTPCSRILKAMAICCSIPRTDAAATPASLIVHRPVTVECDRYRHRPSRCSASSYRRSSMFRRSGSSESATIAPSTRSMKRSGSFSCEPSAGIRRMCDDAGSRTCLGLRTGMGNRSCARSVPGSKGSSKPALLVRLLHHCDIVRVWSNQRWRQPERPLDDDGSPGVGGLSMTASEGFSNDR